MRTGIFEHSKLQTIKPLLDNDLFSKKLDLSDSDRPTSLSLFKTLLKIRLVEEAIGDLVERKEVNCPCHLAIGQEAVATGVCQALDNQDWAYGTHRSHAHFIAKGGSISGLVHEVFGKAEGCSKGFGGSMHLYQPSVGFMGSVPIVGATIPIAVGAALTKKKDNTKDIVVAFFGDGTTEEGIFHESLNLARVLHLPVLFVCENNLYSSHMDIRLRQPTELVSRFAAAHHIDSLIVDGNDVFAVLEATFELRKKMLSDQSPAFLEAITYRHRGHVGADRNIDVGLRRKIDDLKFWEERCPVKRLQSALLDSEWISEEQLDKLQAEIKEDIESAIEHAKTAPYPESSALLDAVLSADSSLLSMGYDE